MHNLPSQNMNPKNTKKKSPIHMNADTNITCDFGDGDISHLGVAYLTHAIHTYIATSIILRLYIFHTIIHRIYLYRPTNTNDFFTLPFCTFCSTTIMARQARCAMVQYGRSRSSLQESPLGGVHLLHVKLGGSVRGTTCQRENCQGRTRKTGLNGGVS